MGWFLCGMLLSAVLGAAWWWIVFGPDVDDRTMPADRRRRDEWRETGR